MPQALTNRQKFCHFGKRLLTNVVYKCKLYARFTTVNERGIVMDKDYNISETEWKIMEVVWQNPNIGFGEIKNELSDMGWSDSTIKTLIRRLVAKQALGFEEAGGFNKYYAKVGQDECRKRETKNLIDRIYNGSVKMLVTNLVNDSNLSDDEAKKLMDIISKMEEGDK